MGLCREATMLRDTLVGLIEPMLPGAGVHCSRAGFSPCCSRHRTIDPQCLENPRPARAESTLTENARSPFHAEPRHAKLRRGCVSNPLRAHPDAFSSDGPPVSLHGVLSFTSWGPQFHLMGSPVSLERTPVSFQTFTHIFPYYPLSSSSPLFCGFTHSVRMAGH